MVNRGAVIERASALKVAEVPCLLGPQVLKGFRVLELSVLEKETIV